MVEEKIFLMAKKSKGASSEKKDYSRYCMVRKANFKA